MNIILMYASSSIYEDYTLKEIYGGEEEPEYQHVYKSYRGITPVDNSLWHKESTVSGLF